MVRILLALAGSTCRVRMAVSPLRLSVVALMQLPQLRLVLN